MKFINGHLDEMIETLQLIDRHSISEAIEELTLLRNKGGRLFIVGVGGSAGNASHAVNDFRKLANIEAYAPTDNVSELTARINDEGWSSSFVNWLKVSKLSEKDMLLVFSVGGGDIELAISTNIVEAINYCNSISTKSIAIVSRPEGFAATNSTIPIMIPVVSEFSMTPHSESMQSVLWHLMVSHPKLKNSDAKWESLEE